MDDQEKREALRQVLETAVKDLCRINGASAEAESKVLRDLVPRLDGVPFYRAPALTVRASHFLSKRQRMIEAEKMAADVLKGVNDHTDELVGYFVMRLVEIELELMAAKQKVAE